MKKMALLLTAVILFAAAYSQQLMMQGWGYIKTAAGKSGADTLRSKAASLKKAGNIYPWIQPHVPASSGPGNNGDDPRNLYRGNTTTGLVQGNVSVLELQVMRFDVQVISKMVQLQWTVEQNEEIKSMEVERSEDGIRFVKLGGRLATNRSGEADYDFVDVTPRKNVSLMYRVNLIGKNGSSQYSDTRTVRIDEGQMTVRLRQNPVRDNAELELTTASAGKAVVTIVSTAGQKMTRQSLRIIAGTNQFAIPAQGLPQGIYQLLVETGNERKTISFVKE